MSTAGPLLPIHGFVLAGGKSTRMGVDKALLHFRGQPLVEIAVKKVRGFCAEVSICGNRDDLAAYAPVVRELRLDAGPAAGMEAGLANARQEWCMFLPVDVPLVPEELLRRWVLQTISAAEESGSAGSLMASSLYTNGGSESAFVILRRELLPWLREELERGERRLHMLWNRLRADFGHAEYLRMDAAWFVSERDREVLERLFSNLNTPQDLSEADAWEASKIRSSRIGMPY